MNSAVLCIRKLAQYGGIFGGSSAGSEDIVNYIQYSSPEGSSHNLDVVKVLKHRSMTMISFPFLLMLLGLPHAYSWQNLFVKVPQSTVRDELLQESIQNSPKVPELVSRLLTESPTVRYNPNECLYGPLYCTVATIETTRSPLWKTWSLKSSNIQGQQYSSDQTVVNYSEIWGSALHIRASGQFIPLSTRNQCPVDYTVTVDQASFHFGKLQWQLPIQGSSILRILYADPELRIFVSPQDTQANVGDWEAAGLTVVQVRSDLVCGQDLYL